MHVCPWFVLGFYMYTEATGASGGDVARLRSASFISNQQTDMCVTFFYHMFGQGQGELSLYFRSTSGVEDRVWHHVATDQRTFV